MICLLGNLVMSWKERKHRSVHWGERARRRGHHPKQNHPPEVQVEQSQPPVKRARLPPRLKSPSFRASTPAAGPSFHPATECQKHLHQRYVMIKSGSKRPLQASHRGIFIYHLKCICIFLVTWKRKAFRSII